MSLRFNALRAIPRRTLAAPRRAVPALFSFFSFCALAATHAVAGVVNPDISALGQVRGSFTDDAASPDKNTPALNLGEAEFIFDAALNPYFRGWFNLAAGEEGVELEEAYATMVRGLPWGLGLKAGKYRLGFGRLNAVHPHAYPFLDAPRAWQSLMPGEEGFNETAVQASMLLPTPGLSDLAGASTISVDLLQGRSFHPEDERSALGWLGRWSHALLLGDAGALEAGVSGATGLDDVDAKARGYLLGVDAKTKLRFDASELTLQAEGAWRRSHSVDTLSGDVSAEERAGFYGFADYRYRARWNAGVLFEQWQREGAPEFSDRAVKAFAGFAVMEESTLLRLAVERFMPEGEAAVHTVSLQLLFSMGPHKPHQF